MLRRASESTRQSRREHECCWHRRDQQKARPPEPSAVPGPPPGVDQHESRQKQHRRIEKRGNFRICDAPGLRHEGESRRETRVNIAPNMRLSDRDMHATIVYIDETLFDASALSEFRTRLITGKAEGLLLVMLLAWCREVESGKCAGS